MTPDTALGPQPRLHLQGTAVAIEGRGVLLRGPSGAGKSSLALRLIEDGADIPIERRDPREVTHIAGWTEEGQRAEVRLTPENSPAANFAFDVTPARLVTALITERGICAASRDGLLGLFPERCVRGAA